MTTHISVDAGRAYLEPAQWRPKQESPDWLSTRQALYGIRGAHAVELNEAVLAESSKIWKASFFKLLLERTLIWVMPLVSAVLLLIRSHQPLLETIAILLIGLNAIIAAFSAFVTASELPLYLIERRNRTEKFAFTEAVGGIVRNKKLFVLAAFAAVSVLAVPAHLPTDFVVITAAVAIWAAIDAWVIHYRVRSGIYGEIEAEVLEAARFSYKIPRPNAKQQAENP